MNNTNLYYLLSVDEIVAIKNTNIRNCKVKDMTFEELQELSLYMIGMQTNKIGAISTICELLYRYDLRELKKDSEPPMMGMSY